MKKLQIYFRYGAGEGKQNIPLTYDSIIMDEKYKDRKYCHHNAGYDFAIIVLSKESSMAIERSCKIKERGVQFLTQE